MTTTMRALARSLGISVVMSLALTACPAPVHDVDGGPIDDAGASDAGVDDAGPSDAGDDAPDFKSVLDHENDLDDLRGVDGFTKFLAQVDGAPVTPPILSACEFQNTTRYTFHLPFLNSQPGGENITFNEYVADVIKRDTRVWWGGDVIFLSQTPHPLTHTPGTFAWHLYTEDSQNNRLTLDDVRAGNARLAACAPAFAGKLAFEPASNEQILTTRNGQAELAAEGIAVLVH